MSMFVKGLHSPRMTECCWHLLPHVDLIKTAAVRKMLFVRLGPAAKSLLDGEQFDIGQQLRILGLRFG